ncbi:nucleotidyltransferase family protein [Labrys sp. LIt4]|uniref:nucleotidyltransferase family protein n=1 Tax=Labrys sp. LIt4 TaxID=2821355 RepID=UPI001ADF18B8|nr:nucleotidyltransferase family protein [Labrys sp. LIt4]MBP0579286.1 nucleotidyltransferase family protein [Labrys sp. LIt4]
MPDRSISPEERLRIIVRADENLMAFLAVARSLRLPQWRLAAGCVYQTVWNSLSGLPAATGIKDYDLIYFDAADVSWEAEDAVIRHAAPHFDGRWPVEIRNQARVHLWFEQRFGQPYPQLRSADEAFGHYAAIVHAVGIRLEDDDTIDIAAPFGLDDLFGMIIRPNPGRRGDKGLAAKAARAKAIWPELRLVDLQP